MKLLTYKNGILIIVKPFEQFWHDRVSEHAPKVVARLSLSADAKEANLQNTYSSITNKWAVWKLRLLLHITRQQIWFFKITQYNTK